MEHGTRIYSTLLKKPIFVILMIHVYTAHRPKRGKLAYILGHNGITKMCWMYSIYWPKSTDRQLQSCNLCFQHCAGKAKTNPKFNFVTNYCCGHCADWNHNHANMKVLKPNGYPFSCHIDSPDPYKEQKLYKVSHLCSMILSINNLKESARF